MKWMTVRLYLKNEQGEPENTYEVTYDSEPEHPEDYMLTRYDGGKRGSSSQSNRVRFLDGETGENINHQKYYNLGGEGCNSMLVYQELKSPLFRQMVKSLQNYYANPNTQIVTLVIIGLVASVGLYLFLR